MPFLQGEKVAKVNLGIIAANIVYFVILVVTGGSTNTANLIRMGGLTAYGVLQEHKIYLLLTSMFMHAGISHLFNNMLVLFFLGDNMERALGRTRYLLFYLACGIGSGIASLIWYGILGQDVVSIGASGAIFGVVGGLLYVVIANRGRLEDLSTARLALLIGFTLYHGLMSAGVNNAAHIGGILVGFVLAKFLYKRPTARYSDTGVFDSYSDSDWR